MRVAELLSDLTTLRPEVCVSHATTTLFYQYRRNQTNSITRTKKPP
jgi:hypothetical protein